MALRRLDDYGKYLTRPKAHTFIDEDFKSKVENEYDDGDLGPNTPFPTADQAGWTIKPPAPAAPIEVTWKPGNFIYMVGMLKGNYKKKRLLSTVGLAATLEPRMHDAEARLVETMRADMRQLRAKVDTLKRVKLKIIFTNEKSCLSYLGTDAAGERCVAQAPLPLQKASTALRTPPRRAARPRQEVNCATAATRAGGPKNLTFFKMSFTPRDAYLRVELALTKQEQVSEYPQHAHRPYT